MAVGSIGGAGWWWHKLNKETEGLRNMPIKSVHTQPPPSSKEMAPLGERSGKGVVVDTPYV